MNRDTVIALAREAGYIGVQFTSISTLERFAALVAAAERDRICTMLDDLHKQEERHNYYGFIKNMIRDGK